MEVTTAKVKVKNTFASVKKQLVYNHIKATQQRQRFRQRKVCFLYSVMPGIDIIVSSTFEVCLGQIGFKEYTSFKIRIGKVTLG